MERASGGLVDKVEYRGPRARFIAGGTIPHKVAILQPNQVLILLLLLLLLLVLVLVLEGRHGGWAGTTMGWYGLTTPYHSGALPVWSEKKNNGWCAETGGRTCGWMAVGKLLP